jgi:hypothetical protein
MKAVNRAGLRRLGKLATRHRTVTTWRICPSVPVASARPRLRSSTERAPSTCTLSSLLSGQLPYVDPDLRLTLKNRSAGPVPFPASGAHVRILLEQGGKWGECHPVVASAPAGTGTVKWEEIEAGGERAIRVPATRCLCDGKEPTDMCREWTAVPGRYRLKAIVSTDASDQTGPNSTPAGALRGSLESPPVEIVVRQPTGADAKVISWANGFSPLTLSVLHDFPNPDGTRLYGSLRRDTADPVRTGRSSSDTCIPVKSPA